MWRRFNNFVTFYRPFWFGFFGNEFFISLGLTKCKLSFSCSITFLHSNHNYEKCSKASCNPKRIQNWLSSIHPEKSSDIKCQASLLGKWNSMDFLFPYFFSRNFVIIYYRSKLAIQLKIHNLDCQSSSWKAAQRGLCNLDSLTSPSKVLCM